MSTINKCFLKLNKKIVEKEPEELCFDDFVVIKDDPEPQYDEPEQEFELDEEYIKQQKKIGLMCNCGLTTVLREVKKD